MNDIVSIRDRLEKEELRLNEAAKEIYASSREKALTEQQYKMELAKKKLALRLDKIPIAMIDDLAKGDEHIADLRFKRDVARGKHEANVLLLKSIHTSISALQSIMRHYVD